MRKRLLPLLPLLAGALLAGCDNSTAPADFSLVGTWETQGFAPATVQMTLVESARAPTGAGRWMTPLGVDAFRVTGAHVEERVSLFFDFDDPSLRGIQFFGELTDPDSDSENTVFLIGELYGGGYNGQPIQFARVTFEED